MPFFVFIAYHHLLTADIGSWEANKEVSVIMRKRKSDWIKQFREILKSIDKQQFSSLDFIGRFRKLYEQEWKQLLERYEIDANRKVNAYIARMLSSYAKDVPVQKMKELKLSKNIHASMSKVHWWKKVTVLLLFFMTSNIIFAEEYNQLSTFLQHIKGWEWVYMEKGRTEEIKTPYMSFRYKEYDSHPEYKVVIDAYYYNGMSTIVTIFDTNGNLVRRLTDVDGVYSYDDAKRKSKRIANKELYHIAHGEKVTQSLAKLSHFSPYIELDERLMEHDYDECNYEYHLGKGPSKFKKADIRIVDELNTHIKNQHMQVFIDTRWSNLYCRFDSVFADSFYNEICKSHFGDGFEVKNNRRVSFDDGVIQSVYFGSKTKMVIDSLCHRQMVADYLNNMYDVKTKENKETLMAIEQELGIKNKKNNVNIDSLASENSEVYNDVGKIKCEMMGLPNDEKYYTMGEAEIRKEIQKYHPNWTTLEIGNRYLAAIQRVTEYLASSVIIGSIVSSASETFVSMNRANRAANNYLKFLKEEYQYVVTDIQRIDATTFEATIEIAPRGTLHKIIIQYRQTKPYEYIRDVQIVS